MSDDDVRERSPLQEAAPREWLQLGGGQGAAGGCGQGPGPQRIRKGIRNERDSTASRTGIHPITQQYRGGGKITTQSRHKTILPTSPLINSTTSFLQHQSASRNFPVLSTFNPYPPRGIGGQNAATSPTPGPRSPALPSRKRSSNPSSPDLPKKPAVPEKSPNLGKTCQTIRPSKLPIVSVFGGVKQPGHDAKKIRKTSADLAGVGSPTELARKQEMRHRASPFNGRSGSPKRGDVRRVPSPTQQTWRRSPSSSRSRPSSPNGRAGSPLSCRPPSPARTTSPGTRRRTFVRPGSPAHGSRGSRPPSPMSSRGSRPPSPRRGSRPPSPRSAAAMKRHPSPSQLDPQQAECVRKRVGQLSKVRLYLLQKVGSYSFLVAEEDTNYKYKVNIGPQSMEHLHLEQSAPNRPLNDDNNNTKHTNNNDDALCPICLSEMDISEQLCSCSACNNYLHRPCMDVWSQECISQLGPVLCPLCRSHWNNHGHPGKQQRTGYWCVSRTSDTMHMIEQNGCPEDIPLPTNESISQSDYQMASIWMQHFSRDLVACLLNREWLKRETGLRRLAREIVTYLKYFKIENGDKIDQCKCCIEILQVLLEDKVYKVYVAAIKALGALLNFYPIRDEAQFNILRGQLKQVLDVIVVKCGDANKKIGEVSLDTIVRVIEGSDGDMGIGKYSQINIRYSGIDLVLDVVIEDHDPQLVTAQWTLGRLIVLEHILERFQDKFSLESSPNAQANFNRLMLIIHFTFQKLTNSHLKIAKMANKVMTLAARFTFDDNITFQQVWRSLEVLDNSLEMKIKKNIASALEKQYGTFQGSSTSSSPSSGSPDAQDKAVLLESFFNQGSRNICSNKHCAASLQENSLKSGRSRPPLLRSTSHSPSRIQSSISMSTSDGQHRFAKARSPPLLTTNSITTNYNKMKMKFEYSLLSDGIGDSLMEVDQDMEEQMAAHFGVPKFSGPMTRSRSSQLEQGLYKSGSCKDFMEYQNTFAFTAFLSRSSSEEIPLPVIPGLSSKPLDASNPHKQNMEGVRDYREGIDWTKGNVLGTGAFSTCYQARDVNTGTLMAAKQISFNRTSDEEKQKIEKLVKEEISLMSRLQHPNIVRMFGAIQEGDYINVFEEWMPGGSIAGLLDKHGPFTHQVIISYTRQILHGIHYLHSNGILHRDIKGANLLVDTSGHHLRIADFGAAARMIANNTIQGQFKGDLQGTIAFMAPEVLRGDSYGRACDIWSLGCTIIEMATGKPPWGAADISNHLTLIFMIACSKEPPSIPENLSADLKQITLRCLEIDGANRPTSIDLLLHPLLNQSMD